MITFDESNPLETLTLEPGAEELYFRSPEGEEMSSVWVSAADEAGEDPRDIQRITAVLAEQWRCQVWERHEVTLVVGRYRLLDEALRIRDRMASLPTVEQRPLIAALATVSAVLQDLPEEWFIDAEAAAKVYSVSQRRMTQLIGQGRVPGAHKRGRLWMVPKEFEVLEHSEKPRKRPEWRVIVEENMLVEPYYSMHAAFKRAYELSRENPEQWVDLHIPDGRAPGAHISFSAGQPIVTGELRDESIRALVSRYSNRFQEDETGTKA